MSHRKWRETKLHPSRVTSGHQISCCLVPSVSCAASCVVTQYTYLFDFWIPLTPLSAVGSDMQYRIHTTSLTSSAYLVAPAPSHCEHHLSMLPYRMNSPLEQRIAPAAFSANILLLPRESLSNLVFIQNRDCAICKREEVKKGNRDNTYMMSTKFSDYTEIG